MRQLIQIARHYLKNKTKLTSTLLDCCLCRWVGKDDGWSILVIWYVSNTCVVLKEIRFVMLKSCSFQKDSNFSEYLKIREWEPARNEPKSRLRLWLLFKEEKFVGGHFDTYFKNIIFVNKISVYKKIVFYLLT